MNKRRQASIFLYVIVIMIGIGIVLSQTATLTPCQQISSSAKSYDDCKKHDNTTAETICCFIQGTSNNTSETGCLDVDILFAGKIITYSAGGVSGKMICQSGTSSSFSLHLSFPLLLIMSFFFL